MTKKQIPERTVVPGMLDGINYAELIKRDSNNVIGTVDVPKKQKVKTYYIKNKSRLNKI